MHLLKRKKSVSKATAAASSTAASPAAAAASNNSRASRMAEPGEDIPLELGWKQIREKALAQLEEILEQGLSMSTKPFPPEVYSPIYTICYNMCTQRVPYNWSTELYERHGKFFEEYLSAKVLPALQDKRDEFLLEELVSRWTRHKVMNKWMQKFFMYLDRYHVKHHSLPNLKSAGLQAFKTLVFDKIKGDIVSAVLKQVNRERDGETVDRALLKQAVSVFEAMGMQSLEVYNSDFEADLLADTAEFYKKKSQDWIVTDSTPDYMLKAETALNEEAKRVAAYMINSTEAKLLLVVETELLAKHETTLLEKQGSGFTFLMAGDKKEDLARMFRLFSRVEDGLQPIAAMVKTHITKAGEDIVSTRSAAVAIAKKDNASDPTLVKSLLLLHEQYRDLIAGQFDGHNLFQKALKEAFEVFVNHDVGNVTNAELMSTFCDRILKPGGDKLSEQQVEEQLEKVVQLFSYLSDKDLFAEIFRNQLAKRILDGRSTSDDAERSMISKLKLRCGAQFTGKMEGMITDLSMGDDQRRKFKEHLSNPGAMAAEAAAKAAKKVTSVTATASASTAIVALPANLDFGVQVLTTGFWPTYELFDVTLPGEMAKCVEVFSAYYGQVTSHRQLKWVLSLGQATIRANMKKPYDLVVTTLQAIALMNMDAIALTAGAPSGEEDGPEWVTFDTLKQRTNMEDEVMKRVMHSLSCGKYKVLRKSTDSKGVSKNDKFKINTTFACPLRKVRIPMASLEKSHNPKRVEEDRSIAIEAAVVRIMKARKQLAHHLLVTEVIQQLHFFKPNPKVVKKRIEHLIDREYLERDEDSPNIYRYLA